MPGGERVAGVQADADPRGVVERGGVRRELLHAAAQRPAQAGGRLQQHVRTLGIVEQREQRLAHLEEGGGPVTGVDGRAGVHDHAASPDVGAAPQRELDGRGRQLDGSGGGGAEVHQVRRVDVRRHAPLLAAGPERAVLLAVAGRLRPCGPGRRRP